MSFLGCGEIFMVMGAAEHRRPKPTTPSPNAREENKMKKNSLTNGQKDVLGKAKLAFDGGRELISGSEVRMFHHDDSTISTGFRHHNMKSVSVETREFEVSKECEAFKLLEIEGIDEKGNAISVKLFMKPSVKISFKI
jgi:hypothetical protein